MIIITILRYANTPKENKKVRFGDFIDLKSGYTGEDKGINGAQIDLLIERRDRVVSICEMKYSVTKLKRMNVIEREGSSQKRHWLVKI